MKHRVPPGFRLILLLATGALMSCQSGTPRKPKEIPLPPPVYPEYPVERPPRKTAPPAESNVRVYPDRVKQRIAGLGFEIQSDSINSGNRGLPEETTSVPHDLTPAERERFVREMLDGFRYCRLAGGLYWRGYDAEKKYLQPRWPGQLKELREMITAAGIEGVSFEYWSPPPFWKANGKYTGRDWTENKLRCFGKDFKNDPVYHGDVDRFLRDYADACLRDLQTLRKHGIPIAMWGLKNEPPVNQYYSTCVYTPAEYARTFREVAPRVRAFDPKIMIIADTAFTWKFNYIRPVLNDPATAGLVDALVIHHIGSDSATVDPPPEPSGKPRFQNEYEYLKGPTSPARCLNTVQHIMNWFQRGEAPTWFWIHALKPYKNEEASGYSLGFWRPKNDLDDSRYPRGLKPGHWVWNKYNWHAVGSFLRHMPWDCQAVEVSEKRSDEDLRIFAFKRPNGKLTIVLSNRSFSGHQFNVDTGLRNRVFRGYRYTPEVAGDDCQGVPLGEMRGGQISPRVPDMAWEFWEEQ
jgi:O-glycosyl hydrolase